MNLIHLPVSCLSTKQYNFIYIIIYLLIKKLFAHIMKNKSFKFTYGLFIKIHQILKHIQINQSNYISYVMVITLKRSGR